MQKGLLLIVFILILGRFKSKTSIDIKHNDIALSFNFETSLIHALACFEENCQNLKILPIK